MNDFEKTLFGIHQYCNVKNTLIEWPPAITMNERCPSCGESALVSSVCVAHREFQVLKEVIVVKY